MKRSVLKDVVVSDYTRAEFLNFSFFFILLKAKFKNLAVFVNTQKSLRKPLIAMFYIHCCVQFYNHPFILSIVFFNCEIPDRTLSSEILSSK
jgi:hypothetical protein